VRGKQFRKASTVIPDLGSDDNEYTAKKSALRTSLAHTAQWRKFPVRGDVSYERIAEAGASSLRPMDEAPRKRDGRMDRRSILNIIEYYHIEMDRIKDRTIAAP
jgi:hypothetical protein